LLRLQTTAAVKIYVHNILFNGQTAPISDFGAASPLPKDDKARAFLQSLDRRAYQIMQEELTDMCDGLRSRCNALYIAFAPIAVIASSTR
jgi:hypothetical protein